MNMGSFYDLRLRVLQLLLYRFYSPHLFSLNLLLFFCHLLGIRRAYVGRNLQPHDCVSIGLAQPPVELAAGMRRSSGPRRIRSQARRAGTNVVPVLVVLRLIGEETIALLCAVLSQHFFVFFFFDLLIFLCDCL